MKKKVQCRIRYPPPTTQSSQTREKKTDRERTVFQLDKFQPLLALLLLLPLLLDSMSLTIRLPPSSTTRRRRPSSRTRTLLNRMRPPSRPVQPVACVLLEGTVHLCLCGTMKETDKIGLRQSVGSSFGMRNRGRSRVPRKRNHRSTAPASVFHPKTGEKSRRTRR